MLINAIDSEESRIAVVEDGVLQELHVELANREAYLGNIYKGKVVNIEPSIGAAFVAFGGELTASYTSVMCYLRTVVQSSGLKM